MLGFDANGDLIYPSGPNYISSTDVGVANVGTRQTAQVTRFAESVNVVVTYGQDTPGDRLGNSYIRGVSGGPGAFQDGDGVYWNFGHVQGDAAQILETIAAARAAFIPSTVNVFRTAGRVTVGVGAAVYTRLLSVPSPVKPWHEQTADGAYWILSPQPVLRPEMFDGGDPSVSTDCGPAIRNCRDYIAALGGGILI